MKLMGTVTRQRSMSTISKTVTEIVGVSKTKTHKATSDLCTFMGIPHHSRSEISTIISKFIKLYSARDSYHMENIRQHKIQKYEEFVDKSLKPDLLHATTLVFTCILFLVVANNVYRCSVADSFSEVYIELAILLALMVGIPECIMGLLRS
ncbi:hypothetical protein P8452_43218 [Trifolium repens]|nr:hypothetical protein P8452_43218 [Trifolium repens]